MHVYPAQTRGAQGIHDSWRGLRETLINQCRITATLHVRKATPAEPEQLAIYKSLNIDPAPGGVNKLII